MQTDDRIAFLAQVDEVAAVDPFLLEELDRIKGPSADEDEEEAAILGRISGGGNIRRPFCQIACNRDPGIASNSDPLAA